MLLTGRLALWIVGMRCQVVIEGPKFLNAQQVTVSAAHKLCLYHIFYSFREQIFDIYKTRAVHSENHRFKINQKALGYRLRTATCTISERGSGNAT